MSRVGYPVALTRYYSESSQLKDLEYIYTASTFLNLERCSKRAVMASALVMRHSTATVRSLRLPENDFKKLCLPNDSSHSRSYAFTLHSVGSEI
jgi:hypothetical protein